MSDYWTENGLIKPPQRIVCAAIRNDETGDIILGARHFDSLMRKELDRYHHLNDRRAWKRATQGFIDQYCEFLTREEAYIIAKERGQIYREDGGSGDGMTLYSEMLY